MTNPSTKSEAVTAINISTWSIVKVILVLLGVWALYLIREVIVLVFVSLILASALHGWVQRLASRRIPKVIAVLLIYIILFVVASGVVALLVPPLADQVRSIAVNVPDAVARLTSGFAQVRELGQQVGVGQEISRTLQSLSGLIAKQGGGALDAIAGFFGSILSFAVVLIITVYIIVQEDAIKEALRAVIPDQYSNRVSAIIIQIQNKVGLWLRGELILMGIIALLAYIGLLIVGVNNALALALFAGLTEVVPTLGPIIGAVPAVFLALLDSPFKALVVVVLYILIQQLENNLIVPQVMRKAVGINPVVSLLALLIGAKVAGLSGAVLAIPTVTALKVVMDNLVDALRSPE